MPRCAGRSSGCSAAAVCRSARRRRARMGPEPAVTAATRTLRRPASAALLAAAWAACVGRARRPQRPAVPCGGRSASAACAPLADAIWPARDRRRSVRRTAPRRLRAAGAGLAVVQGHTGGSRSVHAALNEPWGLASAHERAYVVYQKKIEIVRDLCMVTVTYDAIWLFWRVLVSL